ncbi:hypothetical protein ANN_13783 [Periplaneta americana]|uniref:Transposase Tc1-like domain-containing protein n=1 Tax=Periplaneta americana TaxID=6978 RepID=A0ABQ8SUH6_PERAM|nr:hypothetical protein ANN_13783 [Periplaneta americana]
MGIRCGLVDKASARRAENPGSNSDDQFLRLQLLRNSHTTAIEARNRIEEVRGVNVSEWTVRRRLPDAGLISRRPAPGPEFTRQLRQNRLQFARKHQEWANEQLGTVLFSDESRFCLRSPHGKESVWRRTEERKNDAETDQEEEKELVGSLAEKKLPTEGCTGRNGEREKSSGQKMMSDDRRH